MHFCSQCQNLYYIRIDEKDSNKLVYYCRNCGNEDLNISAESISVSKVLVKSDLQNYSNVINKYTKLDPTLPRINNILCPNPNCGTNKQTSKDEDQIEREIIYIRYNDTNMKYVYLCSTCDEIWTINNINK